MIIFGTDGVTDNFDPVVTKLAIAQAPDIAFADDDGEKSESSDGESASTEPALSSPSRSAIFTNLPSVKRQKWASLPPLITPRNLPIWPHPPPPPPRSNDSTTHVQSLPKQSESLSVPSDHVSAKALNFTDQLELSWSERRQCMLKEMTRIWMELDSARRSENSYVSAVDFGEALLKNVVRVTSQKRQYLEAPSTTKLKAQFSLYTRKKSSLKSKPEEMRNEVSSKIGNLEHIDKELDNLEIRRAWVMDTLRRLPGKLDHATVVTLQLGPVLP